MIISGKGDHLTNDTCDCELIYLLVYQVTKLYSLRIAWCKICRERIGSRTGGPEGFKCALSLEAMLGLFACLHISSRQGKECDEGGRGTELPLDSCRKLLPSHGSKFLVGTGGGGFWVCLLCYRKSQNSNTQDMSPSTKTEVSKGLGHLLHDGSCDSLFFLAIWFVSWELKPHLRRDKPDGRQQEGILRGDSGPKYAPGPHSRNKQSREASSLFVIAIPSARMLRASQFCSGQVFRF